MMARVCVCGFAVEGLCSTSSVPVARFLSRSASQQKHADFDDITPPMSQGWTVWIEHGINKAHALFGTQRECTNIPTVCVTYKME